MISCQRSIGSWDVITVERRNLGRADLLILDDWGLEPLDAAARHDLPEKSSKSDTDVKAGTAQAIGLCVGASAFFDRGPVGAGGGRAEAARIAAGRASDEPGQ